MLDEADNRLLTRVGPGTAMGGLFREYWLPFLYSWELAPDGPPLRVRLLGEDLIAFRDSGGSAQNFGDLLPASSEPFGAFRAVRNRDNDFLIDRDMQRTQNFSGLPFVPLQDKMITEGMGPILNRGNEHLDSADAMIIHFSAAGHARRQRAGRAGRAGAGRGPACARARLCPNRHQQACRPSKRELTGRRRLP